MGRKLTLIEISAQEVPRIPPRSLPSLRSLPFPQGAAPLKPSALESIGDPYKPSLLKAFLQISLLIFPQGKIVFLKKKMLLKVIKAKITADAFAR